MEIYRFDPSAARRGRPRASLDWPLLGLEPGDAFDMPLVLGETWRGDRVAPGGHKVSYLRVRASADGIATGRKFSLRANRDAKTLTVIRVA